MSRFAEPLASQAGEDGEFKLASPSLLQMGKPRPGAGWGAPVLQG